MSSSDATSLNSIGILYVSLSWLTYSTIFIDSCIILIADSSPQAKELSFKDFLILGWILGAIFGPIGNDSDSVSSNLI